MAPSNSQGKTGLRPRPRSTWVTHSKIAAEMRRHDCNVIGLLAEIAKDRTVEPALRFRAIERLASLQYLPSDPGIPSPSAAPDKSPAGSKPEPVDIGAAIAANWAKDE